MNDIYLYLFAADKHLPNGARHRWGLHLCHLELCGPQLAFTHWGRRWYHQGRGRSSSIRKSLGNPELLSVVSRSHCRFGSHLIKHFAQKEIHLHISHTHTHTHMRAANTAMFIIDGYQATAKFSLALPLLLILIHFTFQTLVWCSNLYCKMCHPLVSCFIVNALVWVATCMVTYIVFMETLQKFPGNTLCCRAN